MAGAEPNGFLVETSERADLNQYWFSRPTITAFVDEIVDCGGSAALVSSPSVYFSLPEIVRDRCKVLDYDRQWEANPGYVFYDFNDPEGVPTALHQAFDFVLVDPPFITREVWIKYAVTARLLLKEGGRLLCTTIAENEGMMQELLSLRPVLFRPSIPNLVYQYSVYTNYSSQRLDRLNPEVDDEDWRPAASAAAGVMASRQGADDLQVLQESCKDNLPAHEALFACGKEGMPLPAEDLGPLPPGVEILMELRERLGDVKRTFGALFAPLQTAARNRSASGEAASSSTAKAKAAIDDSQAASARLDELLQASAAAIAEALGESPEAFASSLQQDRWHSKAISSMIASAQGEGLQSMDACKEFALTGKQHAAAIFRSSNLILDRIKVLKRNPAAGMQPVS